MSGKSYSNPAYLTFVIPAVDFGAGNSAHAIKLPAGFSAGRLIDVGVEVTETFNAVTTPAFVRIGTASDPDAYAQLQMDAAAATDFWNTQDDPDAIIDADIPDLTQLEVACVAPTGGTPAGIGTVHILIAAW